MATVIRPPVPGGSRPSGPRSPMGAPQTVVPPGYVPLGFLTVAGVGLVLFGLALARAASDIVRSPALPKVLTAVHSGLLGFLTIGVLGAMHQFGPVVSGRPLRSKAAVWPTAALLLPGVALLAVGFSTSPAWLVPAGGVTAFCGIAIAAWNLSGPLLTKGRGVPVVGLRLALGYLLLTVCFGVVYAFDRSTGWFPLADHRVLAHAHLGLLGWLGLAYVSVAEKLWPMFLLAHRPKARSGAVAVAGFGAGVLPLAVGLLFGWAPLAWLGGALVLIGAGGHLVSLVSVIHHRRRPLELLHAFVISAAVALVVAAVCGVVAGLVPMGYDLRRRLVDVEVTALLSWLAMALVGHAHKVVPFITWTELRKAGRIGKPGTRPVLFADLYRGWAARVTYALLAGAVALALAATASETAAPMVVAGGLFSATGVVALWNLLTGPRRALQGQAAATRSAEPAARPAEPAAGPGEPPAASSPDVPSGPPRAQGLRTPTA